MIPGVTVHSIPCWSVLIPVDLIDKRCRCAQYTLLISIGSRCQHEQCTLLTSIPGVTMDMLVSPCTVSLVGLYLYQTLPCTCWTVLMPGVSMCNVPYWPVLIPGVSMHSTPYWPVFVSGVTMHLLICIDGRCHQALVDLYWCLVSPCTCWSVLMAGVTRHLLICIDALYHHALVDLYWWQVSPGTCWSVLLPCITMHLLICIDGRCHQALVDLYWCLVSPCTCWSVLMAGVTMHLLICIDALCHHALVDLYWCLVSPCTCWSVLMPCVTMHSAPCWPVFVSSVTMHCWPVLIPGTRCQHAHAPCWFVLVPLPGVSMHLHLIGLYWYQASSYTLHLTDLYWRQMLTCTVHLVDLYWYQASSCTVYLVDQFLCQASPCARWSVLMPGVTMHLLITMYWCQVSACTVHLIELEPRHGVMQVMWEQQFFLATSPQLHHLQSDESLLRWFDERGTFISSSSASVGKITQGGVYTGSLHSLVRKFSIERVYWFKHVGRGFFVLCFCLQVQLYWSVLITGFIELLHAKDELLHANMVI